MDNLPLLQVVLAYAQPGEVFAFVGSSYGRGYVRVVTAIGPNPERDSELYVLDLSYDSREAAVGESGSPLARQCRAVLFGRLADARLHILGECIFCSESPEIMDES